MDAGGGDSTNVALEVHQLDGACVVTVRGEIDATTAPQLQAVLDDVVGNGSGPARSAATAARGRRVVLDLAAVELLDSTGLGVLIRTGRRLRADGGWLRLAAAPRLVRRVLEVTGVDGELPPHDDVATALGAP